MSKYITFISEWLKAPADVQEAVLEKARELSAAHTATLTRRSALGGLALLPASAGAALASQSVIETPLERARRHFAAFAAAMDEISSDSHGWKIMYAGRTDAYQNFAARPLFVEAQLVRFENPHAPLPARVVIESHVGRIDL